MNGEIRALGVRTVIYLVLVDTGTHCDIPGASGHRYAL